MLYNYKNKIFMTCEGMILSKEKDLRRGQRVLKGAATTVDS